MYPNVNPISFVNELIIKVGRLLHHDHSRMWCRMSVFCVYKFVFAGDRWMPCLSKQRWNVQTHIKSNLENLPDNIVCLELPGTEAFKSYAFTPHSLTNCKQLTARCNSFQFTSFTFKNLTSFLDFFWGEIESIKRIVTYSDQWSDLTCLHYSVTMRNIFLT